MSLQVKEFFDNDSNTYSYVLWCETSLEAAVIDPVLNFDAASGRCSYQGADSLIAYIQQQRLSLHWLLETHVHADHLSAAPYIQQQLGGKTGIGSRICEVQQTFADIFHVGAEFARDGRQFDLLLENGAQLPLGQYQISVLHSPGHTPACVCYQVADAVFVGDTLFMPDYGSARCDFPGGDAATLYQSVQNLFLLPDNTRMFLCHDYKASGRNEFCFQSSIGEQKSANIHLHQGVSKQAFVSMRTARDATLSMPKLLLPAVQVNMRAGHFPPAEDNGVVYLKLPMNLF